jgi:diguanylate cyclase (GGDEF)-like protein
MFAYQLSVALFCVLSMPMGIALGWFLKARSVSCLAGAALEHETACEPSTTVPDLTVQRADQVLQSVLAITCEMQRHVSTHVDKLIHVAASLGEGAAADVVEPVGRIVEVNTSLQDQLHASQTALRRHADELNRVTIGLHWDGQACVANRRLFDIELERQVARWHRYGAMFALLLLEIDDWRAINDQFGLSAGDAGSQAVVQIIKRTIREVDYLDRVGEGTFGVIFAECNATSARDVAERIRKSIADARVAYENQTLSLTITGGVAALGKLETSESLLRRVEEALAKAKRDGRDRLVLAALDPAEDHCTHEKALDAPTTAALH